MRSHATLWVTYTRGASSVRILATIGSTTVEQETRFGGTLEVRHRDYIIDRRDLVLDGLAVEPQTGDTITETEASGDFIYEVVPLEGQQSWRWSDVYRLAYRLAADAEDLGNLAVGQPCQAQFHDLAQPIG